MMIGNQRLQRQFDGLLMMGIVMPETCWAASVRQSSKILRLIVASSWVFYLIDRRCTKPQTPNSQMWKRDLSFLPCMPVTICRNLSPILSSQRSSSLQPIFTSRIERCLQNFTAIKSSLSFLVMKAVSLRLFPTHPHFHHSLIPSLTFPLPLFWHPRTDTQRSSVVAAWHHDSVLIHTMKSSPKESRNQFISFETLE
jgi:hypothetical protein